MGPRLHCYIPRPKAISPLVPEKKIFEEFLPYMDMAAILIMWPRCAKQTFVPPIHGGSIWNLASIGPAFSEKIFENGGWMDDNEDGACLCYKLTNEPEGSGELKTKTSRKDTHMDGGIWSGSTLFAFCPFYKILGTNEPCHKKTCLQGCQPTQLACSVAETS